MRSTTSSTHYTRNLHLKDLLPLPLSYSKGAGRNFRAQNDTLLGRRSVLPPKSPVAIYQCALLCSAFIGAFNNAMLIFCLGFWVRDVRLAVRTVR